MQHRHMQVMCTRVSSAVCNTMSRKWFVKLSVWHCDASQPCSDRRWVCGMLHANGASFAFKKLMR